jgi:tetratricopeptide (TPR) repeat protein
LQYAKGNALYALARWREIELANRLMLPILEEHGTPGDLAWFYAGRVVTALRRERYVISEATLANARSGLSESEKADDMSLTAQAQFTLGWVLVLRGKLDEADETLQAAATVSDQIKYMVWHAWSLLWLAVLCRKRGQVAKARRYASLALKVASTDGVPEQVAMAQANLAWVAWREGDVEGVQELGQAALDSWQRGQWVYAFHWAARLPLLAVALESDQPAGALAHARAMLDPQQQRLPEPLEAALAAAVKADEDRPPEARAHLVRAIDLAQETGFL